ncbi:putative carbonic anhydrase domain containing protein [Neospora caninum Liverpool]|nr:putative carbonic anhydrase domain containing protein [Neospora caninum Liverpool]CBZ52908.1 putative carbonic anhydrase domain containing protein [Neospora caninum Liverpool]|eukprot:XP_003882940.1 putative carbonic anhydrase domain containing protein [Neospora caninum Liverpool]
MQGSSAVAGQPQPSLRDAAPGGLGERGVHGSSFVQGPCSGRNSPRLFMQSSLTNASPTLFSQSATGVAVDVGVHPAGCERRLRDSDGEELARPKRQRRAQVSAEMRKEAGGEQAERGERRPVDSFEEIRVAKNGEDKQADLEGRAARERTEHEADTRESPRPSRKVQEAAGGGLFCTKLHCMFVKDVKQPRGAATPADAGLVVPSAVELHSPCQPATGTRTGRGSLSFTFRAWGQRLKATGASHGRWTYEEQGADWSSVVDRACTLTRQSPIDINEAMLPKQKGEVAGAAKSKEDGEHCGPSDAPCVGLNRMLFAEGHEMQLEMMFPEEPVADYVVNWQRGMRLEFEPSKRRPSVPLAPAFGAFRVDGKRYGILQFHFHVPAEHTFAGERRSAELHIVSRHAEHDLLVVGVTLEEADVGEENAFLAGITKVMHALKPHMPPAESVAKTRDTPAPPSSLDKTTCLYAADVEQHVGMMHETEVRDAALRRKRNEKTHGEGGEDDVNTQEHGRPSLVPSEHAEHERLPPLSLRDCLPVGRKTFYRYHGSLTTPPCSEVVLWYVLKESLPASPSLLQQLREMFIVPESNSKGNYRRAQNAEGAAYNQETIYVVDHDGATA